jgi:hypothetical protein
MEDYPADEPPGFFELANEQRRRRTRGNCRSSGDDAMTKLMVIGAAVAVLLFDVAPADAYRGYGYYRPYGYRAFGYRPYAYRPYRAYGYYRPGYRAYGYYRNYRPYWYIPAEQRHWYDRNTAAFNT